MHGWYTLVWIYIGWHVACAHVQYTSKKSDRFRFVPRRFRSVASPFRTGLARHTFRVQLLNKWAVPNKT